MRTRRNHCPARKPSIRGAIERAVAAALGVTLPACTLAVSDTGAGGAASTATASVSTGPFTGTCAPAKFDPDPPDPCGVFFAVACGVPADVQARAEGCYLARADCEDLCPGDGAFFNCHAYGATCVDGAIVPRADGAVEIECTTCNGGAGRRPAGLLSPRPSGPRERHGTSALARWFEDVAHLEDASVHAFARLEAELCEHGAPARLITSARRAQLDERRHARVTGALARALGGHPERARARRPRARSLEAMARENAVEGCVRETFGAAVVRFQAERAEDPTIRRALGRIADDEARHASLSWRVHVWLTSKLDPRARSRVAAAARRAARALANDRREPAIEIARRAGAPRSAARAAILAALASLFAFGATGCDGATDAASSSGATTSASASSGGACGDIAFDTATCDACASASCCAELEACTKGTACRALRSCTLGCAWGDPACPEKCRATHAGGVAGFDALEQCRASGCPTACAPLGHEVCDSTIVYGGEACAACLTDNCCQAYVECAEPDPDGCAACVNGSGPCTAPGDASVACKPACKTECGM